MICMHIAGFQSFAIWEGYKVMYNTRRELPVDVDVRGVHERPASRDTIWVIIVQQYA